MLLTCCCAVLTGARSIRSIGQWARAEGPFGSRRALSTSTSTVQRLVCRVCSGGLVYLLGCDPEGADQVAVDGKAARGSRTATGPAARLISALTTAGGTVSQARVPVKTTGVTTLPALLAPFDITGVTVTGDALHTTADQARFLVEDKKAHYVMTVKLNQKTLFDTLRRLPWQDITAEHVSRGSGHRRRETRAVRVLTVTDLGLGFPTWSKPRVSTGGGEQRRREKSPVRPCT
ncbi:ISAs1 family transposase [Streptomyces sp. NPDC058372]|uniref:ISAs1 family transposase n=1 Tax=Streptomyces sp. NPDC058372 TaxID=3346464 RepID=UPI0036530517